MAKRHKQQFTKEEMQMAKKYENSSGSFLVKETLKQNVIFCLKRSAFLKKTMLVLEVEERGHCIHGFNLVHFFGE